MTTKVGRVSGHRDDVSRAAGNGAVASRADVLFERFIGLHSSHFHRTVQSVPHADSLGHPTNAHATSASDTASAAMTYTMSVRRLTLRRCGSNPTVTSIAGGCSSSVTSVMFSTARRGPARIAAATALVMMSLWGITATSLSASSKAPAVATTSTIDGFTPGTDGGETGEAAATTTVATTTSTSTTTTLPSAVTTIPENCPSPPVAQAVFVGTATRVDRVSATFAVEQIRAGVLDAFLVDNSVQVRYGNDAQYLDEGRRYIVGAVVADAATQLLGSTLRDEAEVIGEPDGLGSQIVCPQFDPVARTLNIDGTTVETPLLSTFFERPWRLVAVFVVPALIVLVLLVGAVWMRRGLSR